VSYKKYQKAGNARHYSKPYLRLYSQVLKNAKSRGHEVSFTYEDYCDIIKHNKTCHYCNRKLKWVKHGPKAYLTNLDRKNPAIGYTKRNVVAACWQCNNAKSDTFSYRDWFAMTEVLRERRSK